MKVRAELHRLITNNADIEEWQEYIDRQINHYEKGGCEILNVQIVVKDPKQMTGFYLLVTYRPPVDED